jgi:hypothetical protein
MSLISLHITFGIETAPKNARMRRLFANAISLRRFAGAESGPAKREQLPAVEIVLDVIAWFGELASFCAKVARAIFVRPFEGAELLRQFDSVGAKSFPLVALAGAATGVVLSMQTRDSLARFGAKSMLPAVIIFVSFQQVCVVSAGRNSVSRFAQGRSEWSWLRCDQPSLVRQGLA